MSKTRGVNIDEARVSINAMKENPDVMKVDFKRIILTPNEVKVNLDEMIVHLKRLKESPDVIKVDVNEVEVKTEVKKAGDSSVGVSAIEVKATTD